MRWPRKGILIRLCIYVPLIAYFSWRALDRDGDRDDADAADDDIERKLAPHKRMVTLPDGTQQEIVELTPEQAEAILGPMPALEPREPAPGPPPGQPPTRTSPGAASPGEAPGDPADGAGTSAGR